MGRRTISGKSTSSSRGSTASGGSSGTSKHHHRRRQLPHLKTSCSGGSSQGSVNTSSASSISPVLSRDLSTDTQNYTDSTDLQQFLTETLRSTSSEDRHFLLHLEKKVTAFVRDEQRHQYSFYERSPYFRKLIHQVAAFYGLDHDKENYKFIIVNKTERTRIPDFKFESIPHVGGGYHGHHRGHHRERSSGREQHASRDEYSSKTLKASAPSAIVTSCDNEEEEIEDDGDDKYDLGREHDLQQLPTTSSTFSTATANSSLRGSQDYDTDIIPGSDAGEMASNSDSNSENYLPGLVSKLKPRNVYRSSRPKRASKWELQRQKIKEEQRSLPIYLVKEKFLELVKNNQVLILVGETGCGKSTQVTQYLEKAGYAQNGKIGCTQPRGIAAINVAKRVAEEYGCQLGQQVGYTIRFEDKTSSDTIIKYLTDGMLLKECCLDPNLSTYSVIILDEAHERSLHTDVLFGVVKRIVKQRPNLKLIITSATLDSEKYSRFFYHAPIFRIEGRSHPVEVIYDRSMKSDDDVDVKSCLRCVIDIHRTQAPGDILVFLTGQEEIEKACYQLEHMAGAYRDQLIVRAAYASLEAEKLAKIFLETPPGKRKVIFATNIAETSLTINGIVYVIDSGFVKENVYKPNLRMSQWDVNPISKAQADQRKGRAGRTGPGKCYRMYSEMKYLFFERFKKPDILKTNLANIILQLKKIGVEDLNTFEFMDSPPQTSLNYACNELLALGALDEYDKLTPLGRRMTDFPVDPELSKMLIMSAEFGCSDEIITIVAMLSVQAVFYRSQQQEEDEGNTTEHNDFNDIHGDHLTYLTVFNRWREANYDYKWCKDHRVQYRNMVKAFKIRDQLKSIMHRHKLPLISCESDIDNVRKALLHGYPLKVACIIDGSDRGTYKTPEGELVHIHPPSTLFHVTPQCVVYHEIVKTSKAYMRKLTTIEPSWHRELMQALEVFHKQALNRAITIYENELSQHVRNKDPLVQSELLEVHERAKEMAVDVFVKSKKIGPKETTDKFMSKLMNRIEYIFSEEAEERHDDAVRKAVRSYEKEMGKTLPLLPHYSRPLPLFLRSHENARTSAIRVYQETPKPIYTYEYQQQLESAIEDKKRLYEMELIRAMAKKKQEEEARRKEELARRQKEEALRQKEEARRQEEYRRQRRQHVAEEAENSSSCCCIL